MKRKYLSILILIIFGIGLVPDAVFAQDDEMKKKAMEKMKTWSKSFSDMQYQHLGFKDQAEIENSELGDPYLVYTIDPNDLLEMKDGIPFVEMLKKTGYMIYPVISQGKNKALLWMYQKDNDWKIARMGSSGLAKNLKRNEHSVQEQQEDTGLLGIETLRFVRIYQLYFDFFYMKGAEAEYIMPMQTVLELKLKGSEFYKVKEVLPLLQKELQAKMPFENKEGQKKEY